MHHTRLAVLTIAVMLAIAACSSTSTSATSVPASVNPSAVASSEAAPAAIGSAVSIANFSFQPATITVPVGTTVTWTNNDSANHTVTADDGSFQSESLGSGATFSQTFATAGTFAYHCAIHSSMKGTVVVK
jgi:plastocyanin